jgi:hypothetical protein
MEEARVNKFAFPLIAQSFIFIRDFGTLVRHAKKAEKGSSFSQN